MHKQAPMSEETIEFLGLPKDQNKNSMVTPDALTRRQIHLLDEITDTSFEQIKNVFDKLIEEDQTSPIHFIVGGPGGDASSMLGIMNLMLLSKTPCYTYIFNETCSAASWIYLCGHKRFAPRTNLVSFMLHPISWNTDSESLGNQTSYGKYVEKISCILTEFAAKKTKLTAAKLKRLATVETQFFVGEELFEQGIATDELTTSSFWLTTPVKKPKKAPKIINTPTTLLD